MTLSTNTLDSTERFAPASVMLRALANMPSDAVLSEGMHMGSNQFGEPVWAVHARFMDEYGVMHTRSFDAYNGSILSIEDGDTCECEHAPTMHEGEHMRPLSEGDARRLIWWVITSILVCFLFALTFAH